MTSGPNARRPPDAPGKYGRGRRVRHQENTSMADTAPPTGRPDDSISPNRLDQRLAAQQKARNEYATWRALWAVLLAARPALANAPSGVLIEGDLADQIVAAGEALERIGRLLLTRPAVLEGLRRLSDNHEFCSLAAPTCADLLLVATTKDAQSLTTNLMILGGRLAERDALAWLPFFRDAILPPPPGYRPPVDEPKETSGDGQGEPSAADRQRAEQLMRCEVSSAASPVPQVSKQKQPREQGQPSPERQADITDAIRLAGKPLTRDEIADKLRVKELVPASGGKLSAQLSWMVTNHKLQQLNPRYWLFGVPVPESI
jgi:hypothetical protein